MSQMHLTVRTLVGKKISMEVLSTATFESIKKSLLASEGIPVESQMLIWGGRRFKDAETVGDFCSNSRECMIDLIVRHPVSALSSALRSRASAEAIAALLRSPSNLGSSVRVLHEAAESGCAVDVFEVLLAALPASATT